MAEQAGAASRRLALPPVVPFNLSPEQHFAAPVQVQCHGCPLDFPAPVDRDLQYVSWLMVESYSTLSQLRETALWCLRCLAERLQGVTDHIRSQQAEALKLVNPQVHFALLALMIGVLQWPDTTFCRNLFAGFPATGYVGPCGVWDAQPAPYALDTDVFQHSETDAATLAAEIQQRPIADEDLAVIQSASAEDEKKHWCTPEFGWDALCSFGRPYRLIKRFVITQASGKKRVIDDAAGGGQSAHSHDANHLQFCSALQPCAHVQTLATAVKSRYGPEVPLLEPVVTCGEELPDAYRKIPMRPEHSWSCIVCYPGRSGKGLRLRRYHSMLFGLPLAVTAFNRLPFFLQALTRRIFVLLCSFYYDDATFQDWQSTATHTQSLVAEVMQLLGYPFAQAKSQGPSATGDFLGLVHDLSAAHVTAEIRVWIRDRLQAKISDLINTAFAEQRLHPGTAAKLYGCVTFLDQAAFGKIARAGLSALKDRQCVDTTSMLTPSLVRAFETIQAVIRLQPQRVVRILAGQQPRICGASDAAQDQHVGSGGFLVHTRMFIRLGAVVPITPAVVQLWKPCDVYIAQLELLMVFQAILTFPDEFRYASGVWYIDNIASLMALIKGRSDNLDLDHLAQMIHLLLYHLHSSLWFEWVQSKSNWSDGISRDGFRDKFVKDYSFQCHESTVPILLWQFPILPLSLVFSFL